ncbi:MAG: replicative DNA helicase [Rhodospirillales bacterium]|nr:replicative DNA helicase [Rhodospirillales bacterium]
MVTETVIQNIAPVQDNDGNKPGYRSLPANLEAEQGLLGALLVDNRAMEKVGDFLRSEHFYAAPHRRIFDAIATMIDRGQTASPVTLKTYFEKDSDLSHVGGAAYLADLAASVVSIVNAEDYARTIYDLHLRRELITLGEDVVNESFEHTIERDAVATIEHAEARLFKLAETGDIRGGFLTLKESVLTAIEIAEVAFKTDGHVTGVTTGLTDLDAKLGGLHKSDLLILAGRPSMGKTSLATNIAFNAAKKYAETGGAEGAIVGFFSLEMSADQLATRILADESEISGDAIRKGNISESDFRRFVEASQVLAQVPLYIDDTPALSISAVRTRARRLKRQHGLDLLVIDYLQLLQGSGSRQSETSRVNEISEITRGLKAIAKELQIPVIALSQLSRAVEQREDKRPQLSDLRESGSIEQDSDVVMFVYREEYYLAREEPTQRASEGEEKFLERHEKWAQRLQETANTAEAVIAKQRHGPIGIVRMFFDPNLTRFSDLDNRHS